MEPYFYFCFGIEMYVIVLEPRAYKEVSTSLIFFRRCCCAPFHKTRRNTHSVACDIGILHEQRDTKILQFIESVSRFTLLRSQPSVYWVVYIDRNGEQYLVIRQLPLYVFAFIATFLFLYGDIYEI